MRTNRVKHKLKEGQPSVGTWLALSDYFSASYLARVGFDWLTVDLEHNPVDLESAAKIIAAIAPTGTVPLVRIPWNTPENIKRVLDCGAFGIIVPMVNTPQEAEAAVSAAKYPPRGIRSVGGTLRAHSFATDGSTYFERADDEILVVIQAEHITAVENAEAILSTGGVDAVFIGPNDLCASMGLKPVMNPAHESAVQAIAYIRETAKKHGVAPGIHVSAAEDVSQRIEEGFQFIALSSELGMMLSAARAEITRIRGWSTHESVAS